MSLWYKYTLQTVLFTIVLFFAGMASTLKVDKIKLAFIIASILAFSLAIIKAIILPLA